MLPLQYSTDLYVEISHRMQLSRRTLKKYALILKRESLSTFPFYSFKGYTPHPNTHFAYILLLEPVIEFRIRRKFSIEFFFPAIKNLTRIIIRNCKINL